MIQRITHCPQCETKYRTAPRIAKWHEQRSFSVTCDNPECYTRVDVTITPRPRV